MVSSPATSLERQLSDVRRAFDGVAATYDGPLGNNELVQLMRAELWAAVLASVPAGSRLLDLGCGTGLDAAYFAAHGYDVVAIDWSPCMVERTRARAEAEGVADRVHADVVGIHELERLRGMRFDAIYSDLGALNCLPDLSAVSSACADLMPEGGHMVVSVIGRRCPWEYVYYSLRRDPARARVRGKSGAVPVSLEGETIWTRYYTPREFFQAFAGSFKLESYRGLCWLLPPPYLIHIYKRLGPFRSLLGGLDNRLGSIPLVRDIGDHFLMVLTRRG